jgi:HCOMODA/2-hydroxy-3-carboxy-muconic semialdehyde decarboxylase
MRAALNSKTPGVVMASFIVAIATFTAIYHAQGKIRVVYAQERTTISPAQENAVVADTDESRIADLITAYRISVNEGVLDSFGHISVRSVKDPNRFYMPRASAPGMITRADILELDMNANPILPNAPRTNGERFIHSEIYKARPDVQSVIHAHTMAVIPFGIAGTPLRPVVAQAGFLPLETPLFDSREVYGAAAKERGMLVRNSMLGAALAKKLGNNPVVLMRGHGMTVVADSIKRATIQAVYTQINAQAQLAAKQLDKNITSMDEKELSSSHVENFDLDRPWDNFKNKLPK